MSENLLNRSQLSARRGWGHCRSGIEWLLPSSAANSSHRRPPQVGRELRGVGQHLPLYYENFNSNKIRIKKVFRIFCLTQNNWLITREIASNADSMRVMSVFALSDTIPIGVLLSGLDFNPLLC